MRMSESADKVVTAIVVNYNAGGWLQKSVAALIDSSVCMAVYVVDNHSTDGSIDALRAGIGSGRLTIIENAENRGFAAANNQILKTESSDYFVLVNPDCVMQSDSVEKVINAMERDDDIGLASCTIRDTAGQVQKTCRRRFPTPWSGFVRSVGLARLFPRSAAFQDFDFGGASAAVGVQFVDAVSGAFMVAKGEAIGNVGALDEGYFLHCEDLDWCMRFWTSGYKVAFVPDVEVIHAKGASSGSRRWKVNWHMHRGMIRFYHKFYRDRYPRPLMWLVYAGIGVRFLVKSVCLLPRVLNTGAVHNP